MRAQRPGESALLLLDAIDSLSRSNVAYAVVGAMAASVHGVVRASMGADALLAVHPDELAALERRFREDGFTTELRFGDAADPIGAVLTLADEHGNRVDCALEAAGDAVDFELLRGLAARFGPETSEALEAALRAR
jgi:hypothetical protein